MRFKGMAGTKVRWKENFEVFSKYVLENHKLPDSSLKTEYGDSVYKWFLTQRGSFKNGMLRAEKSEKFENILSGILTIPLKEIDVYLFKGMELEVREYDPDINFLFKNDIIDTVDCKKFITSKCYYLSDILSNPEVKRSMKENMLFGYASLLSSIPDRQYCYLYCRIRDMDILDLYLKSKKKFVEHYLKVFKIFETDYEEICNVSKLSDKNRMFLDSVYGLSGGEPKTTVELSKLLGVSVDNIRANIRKALEKLSIYAKFLDFRVDDSTSLEDYYTMSVCSIPYLSNRIRNALWRNGIHCYKDIHEYLELESPYMTTKYEKLSSLSGMSSSAIKEVEIVAYKLGIHDMVFGF